MIVVGKVSPESRLLMSRRAATFGVAGILIVFLTALAALLPVPYVLLEPGPTSNTLGTEDGKPLIQIKGHQTYPTSGHLQLTTVGVLGGPGNKVDLVTALRGWLDRDVAVVPQEQVYPDGETPEQVEEENAEEMKLSQQNATTAALRQLGIPVTTQLVVESISKGSPALGKVKAGDEIVAVDGQTVTSPDQVRAIISKRKPGETVDLTVRRKGKQLVETVGTTAGPQGQALVGLVPAVAYAYPFDVSISLEKVGGPSAGLMFALGIVDKLTPGELTGGKFIAGTGTIDPDGNVGPIGGIPQKMIAARDKGASMFLVPSGNCAEAVRAAPDGLRLVRAGTLDEAIHAIDAVRDGKGNVPTCPR
jgi:PDZ domain-containing protein